MPKDLLQLHAGHVDVDPDAARTACRLSVFGGVPRSSKTHMPDIVAQSKKGLEEL